MWSFILDILHHIVLLMHLDLLGLFAFAGVAAFARLNKVEFEKEQTMASAGMLNRLIFQVPCVEAISAKRCLWLALQEANS